LNKEAIANAQILNISLLESDEKVDWKKTDTSLKISFPKNNPGKYAYSFKITFDKKVGEQFLSEASNEVMKHGVH
jgi:alpha-L-fucosidase